VEKLVLSHFPASNILVSSWYQQMPCEIKLQVEMWRSQPKFVSVGCEFHVQIRCATKINTSHYSYCDST